MKTSRLCLALQHADYAVTRLDGWAHTRWGPGGMLYCDAAARLVGLLLFAGVLAALPKSKTATAAAGLLGNASADSGRFPAGIRPRS
jgi:hypothetical protein